jgi:hypothetical protein
VFDIHESRAAANSLKGRRIEEVRLEHQEGDAFGLFLRLDDGSVVQVEPWGNSEFRPLIGLPPTTRSGLILWRLSPEQVAESDRQAEEELGDEEPFS